MSHIRLYITGLMRRKRLKARDFQQKKHPLSGMSSLTWSGSQLVRQVYRMMDLIFEMRRFYQGHHLLFKRKEEKKIQRKKKNIPGELKSKGLNHCLPGFSFAGLVAPFFRVLQPMPSNNRSIAQVTAKQLPRLVSYGVY